MTEFELQNKFANEAFFAGWSQGAEDRQLAGFDPGDIRLKILMILVMGPADVAKRSNPNTPVVVG